jgi:hypothetical protein
VLEAPVESDELDVITSPVVVPLVLVGPAVPSSPVEEVPAVVSPPPLALPELAVALAPPPVDEELLPPAAVDEEPPPSPPLASSPQAANSNTPKPIHRAYSNIRLSLMSSSCG